VTTSPSRDPRGGVVLLGTDFVPESDARVDIRSQALNSGASVFEGIRAYWNVTHQQLYVFRLGEHVERLANSSRLLNIKLPGEPGLVARLLCELLRENRFKEDAYIRPLAYKGVPTRFGITLTDAPSEFAAYSFPLEGHSRRDRPIRACCASIRPQPSGDAMAPRAKMAGNYLIAAIAKTEAVGQGFDECIMLTAGGNVVGASTSNVFLTLGEQLVTPKITRTVFSGLTRSCILQLASAELGLTVVERLVNQTELYEADGVFLCGTGAEIVPLAEIDGRSIGTSQGRTTAERLREIYVETARGNSEKYSSVWCTPVY
jgi:branched-chain amino acid aminotransferase